MVWQLAASIQDQVRSTLAVNSDAQGILTLGTVGFEAAKAELGDRVCSGDNTPENSDCIEFGTFDVSPAILNSLVNGEVNFGIDQQQYLQGYLAIAFLYWKALLGGSIGSGGVVMSGTRASECNDCVFLFYLLDEFVMRLVTWFHVAPRGSQGKPFQVGTAVFGHWYFLTSKHGFRNMNWAVAQVL